MKGVPTGRGRLSLFPNMEGSNLSPNFSIIVRRSFLPTKSVLKKLSNEKFVSKAPANVIDMERKKQADAESKIASLKESIAALKK